MKLIFSTFTSHNNILGDFVIKGKYVKQFRYFDIYFVIININRGYQFI